MNAKAGKFIKITAFILLCTLTLGSFLTGSLALAQGEIEKSGALVGGHSDTIPIQLNRGQMVEGKIMATGKPLSVTLNDPTGKKVQDYGSITVGSFSYAAKIDGEHYMVITNPNPIAVHATSYTLTYAILPTNLAPGTGSGNLTLWDYIKPFVTGMLWVMGIVLFVFLILVFPSKEEEKWVPFYIGRRIKISIEDVIIWLRK